MIWLGLAGAVVLEVIGTLALRMAVHGSRRWYAAVAVAYVCAFTLLGWTLAHGMPLGVAYGIWTAAGVALTALAGRVLFGERFTAVMGLGVVLVGAGVVLVELGAGAA